MISVGRNEKVIGGAKNRIELENVYFGNPVYGLNTNIGSIWLRQDEERRRYRIGGGKEELECEAGDGRQ